jgi:hypothetical protein
VPVEGPFVGTTFPPADYVMNFKTGVVFDYAPGSAQPESSGTVRILAAGPNQIP